VLRVAGRGTARRASQRREQKAARIFGRSSREALVQATVSIESPELRVTTDRSPVDDDLRDCPAARQVVEALAKRGLIVERDLLELDAFAAKQGLGSNAVTAPTRCIELDPRHSTCRTKLRRRRFLSIPSLD